MIEVTVTKRVKIRFPSEMHGSPTSRTEVVAFRLKDFESVLEKLKMCYAGISNGSIVAIEILNVE